MTSGSATNIIDELITVMEGDKLCQRFPLQSNFKVRFIADGNTDNEIVSSKLSDMGNDFP